MSLITFIQKVADSLGVMDRSSRNYALFDELRFLINFDVTLIPEMGFAVLLSPTGINILLPQLGFILGLLPVFGYLAILYIVVFITTVSLPGFIYKGCIDDTPRVCIDPLFIKDFPKLVEQFCHSPCLR